MITVFMQQSLSISVENFYFLEIAKAIIAGQKIM